MTEPLLPTMGYLRPERPLAVRLYRPPDSRARAGVVLCPPVGLEEFQARRTLRTLAEQLASEGGLVLSPDYDGTCDSAGSYLDEDRISAWLDSIAVAVRTLRDWGVPDITLVGMRVGGLLAAQVTARTGADALVLWDPVPTGRAFLRAQQFLSTVGLFGADPPPPSTDGTVEGPGLVLSGESAAAVRGLSIAKAEPAYAAVLLVHRGEAPVPTAVPQWPGVTPSLLATDEQPALFDVDTTESQVPTSTLPRIRSWVAARWTELARYTDTSALTLTDTADLGDVVDTSRRLGARALAAVITTPKDREPAAGSPTIVFLNSGADHRGGPGRLWVDLAREWGSLGLRTARVDVTGLGDSPGDPGFPAPAYPDEVVTDLEEIAASLPGPVVFAGLCSGGYHALEAAMHVDAEGVLALNPYLGVGGEVGVHTGDGRSLLRLLRGPRALRGHGYVLDRMPTWSWRILSLMRLHRPPSVLIEAVSRRTPNILVLLSDSDAYPLARRGAWHVETLRSHGVDIREFHGLDHGLLLAHPRRDVGRALTTYVVDHWVDALAS